MNNYIFYKKDVPQIEISINANSENEARVALESKLNQNDDWLLVYCNDEWDLIHVNKDL